VKDLSFLIDVLPTYVFPHDERIISEWGPRGLQPRKARDVARAQTRYALPVFAVAHNELSRRSELRIRMGIPICGLTDFLALMEQRALLPRVAARARGRVRPRRSAPWRVCGEAYIGARVGGRCARAVVSVARVCGGAGRGRRY
jgi:hypothetical protein